MIQKRFEDIAKEDIERLVADGERENRTIEYKQALPGGSDNDKKEFLADVSSFANASGGDLFYGIEDDRDGEGRPTGVPKEAAGIPGINADQTVARLESMIRDGVEPRIPGLRIKAIEGFRDGPVIVVRIPQSWAAPHMITFRPSPRFYSRTSTGKIPLGVPEIRAAFIQSEAVPERIRRFREERLGRIVAGEAPVVLADGARIVTHVVPIRTMTMASQYDPACFVNREAIYPPGGGCTAMRPNLEGYVTSSGDQRGALGYAQFFRNGAVEAVSVTPVESPNGNFLPCEGYEQEILRWSAQCFKILRSLGIDPPFSVMLSLLGMKGVDLYVGPRLHRHSAPINRDVLALPDVLFDGSIEDVASGLRPLFDLVWQTFGYARSFNYDESGHWNPRR
jgi:hypothetical protein